MNLAGKISLVTGGGGGIGRAVCRMLAARGATVIASDINYGAAQKTLEMLEGSSHMALECDVGKSASVKSCFDKIMSELSQPPTLLAHTAGITKDAFITKMSEEAFDQVINVNLKGTFLMTQQFARTLALHTAEGEEPIGGSIVNFSSVVAKNGNMGQGNYAPAKAAVETFTKTAAKELAKQRIRVNCIVPGFINTEMTMTVPEHLRQMTVQVTPMKRMGDPEEVAEAVTFLLSDAASFITGDCLLVTGGLQGTM